ncbi:MAG: hypothetical protein ACKOEM_15960 [Planctomycetia bacterium]
MKRRAPQSLVIVMAVLCPLLPHACGAASESLWRHLGDAADLRDVRAATLEVVGSPSSRRLTLRATGGGHYAWVLIPAPPVEWNLTARRAVEATLTNVGADPVEAMLWGVAAAGWESVADVAVLQPGESRTFSCPLRKTFPDGTPKLDPTRIRGVQVMIKNPKPGQAVEVADLVAAGTEPPWERPPGKIDVPVVEEGIPAAGRRVFHRVGGSRDDSPTQPAAVLWLPRDWKPGATYPVIVEYPGNIFFTAECYSTGRPEQCVIGYGMTRGTGAIWVSLPFLETDGHVAEHGWGDPDATADFCMRAVEDVCDRFGGDRTRLVLTGFSRGAIACGFIGLRNDRIAGLWRGLHCCQHYDGDGWNGSTPEGALERARRFRGVAVFHTDNAAEKVRPFVDALGVPATIVSSRLGAHSCAMFLDDRESTRRLREWFTELTATDAGKRAPSRPPPTP